MRAIINTGLGRTVTVCRVGTEGNIGITGEGFEGKSYNAALPPEALDELIAALIRIRGEVQTIKTA